MKAKGFLVEIFLRLLLRKQYGDFIKIAIPRDENGVPIDPAEGKEIQQEEVRRIVQNLAREASLDPVSMKEFEDQQKIVGSELKIEWENNFGKVVSMLLPLWEALNENARKEIWNEVGGTREITTENITPTLSDALEKVGIRRERVPTQEEKEKFLYLVERMFKKAEASQDISDTTRRLLQRKEQILAKLRDLILVWDLNTIKRRALETISNKDRVAIERYLLEGTVTGIEDKQISFPRSHIESLVRTLANFVRLSPNFLTSDDPEDSILREDLKVLVLRLGEAIDKVGSEGKLLREVLLFPERAKEILEGLEGGFKQILKEYLMAKTLRALPVKRRLRELLREKLGHIIGSPEERVEITIVGERAPEPLSKIYIPPSYEILIESIVNRVIDEKKAGKTPDLADDIKDLADMALQRGTSPIELFDYFQSFIYQIDTEDIPEDEILQEIKRLLMDAFLAVGEELGYDLEYIKRHLQGLHQRLPSEIPSPEEEVARSERPPKESKYDTIFDATRILAGEKGKIIMEEILNPFCEGFLDEAEILYYKGSRDKEESLIKEFLRNGIIPTGDPGLPKGFYLAFNISGVEEGLRNVASQLGAKDLNAKDKADSVALLLRRLGVGSYHIPLSVITEFLKSAASSIFGELLPTSDKKFADYYETFVNIWGKPLIGIHYSGKIDVLRVGGEIWEEAERAYSVPTEIEDLYTFAREKLAEGDIVGIAEGMTDFVTKMATQWNEFDVGARLKMHRDRMEINWKDMLKEIFNLVLDEVLKRDDAYDVLVRLWDALMGRIKEGVNIVNVKNKDWFRNVVRGTVAAALYGAFREISISAGPEHIAPSLSGTSIKIREFLQSKLRECGIPRTEWALLKKSVLVRKLIEFLS